MEVAPGKLLKATQRAVLEAAPVVLLKGGRYRRWFSGLW